MDERPPEPLTQSLGDQLAKKGFETTEQRVKRELSTHFDRVLKGRFDRIPQGFEFKSELPGVETLTIIPAVPPRKNIQVHMNYRGPGGQRRGETFSLTPDGTISGAVPKLLADKVAATDVEREILNRIERYEAVDWLELEEEFFPPDLSEPGKGGGIEGPGGPKVPPVVDLTRLELILKQPDRQALFLGRKGGGFSGVRGIAFPTFLVLENPVVGNAVYFLDIPEFAMPEGLTRDEQKKFIQNQPWMETIRESKGKARKKGATRIFHAGEWKERIEEEITRRLAAWRVMKKRESPA